MLQRVNLGVLPERWQEHPFSDMLSVEWVAWLPLLVGILALGVFPRLVFGTTTEAVQGLLGLLHLG
jgi:NADH:ubiquinone oxidoreductase subunit 4 (subunit M)